MRISDCEFKSAVRNSKSAIFLDMNQFETKQFGKYYLIEKLAVGGMAEIYKAKTFGVDGFEKLLAIKRILPHCAADKDFIAMLIDEAKLSVLLSHVNIVQVYDLGKIGEDYFISMEYIHGINLRDVMYHCREAQRPVPPDIAVYIISEVCKGLDYAHRKTDSAGQPLHIVHRDISPQNILLSYEGEVKIGDFGIAKAAMNISHTMAGILKGKIAYMSPEQALGKAVDHRTDIFSAGILLYEMLTNTKLFTGESQFEVLKKIRTTRVDSAKLPPAIPEQLKEVVAKALAYRPDDRFQSASDLQIELTKYLYSTYLDFSPRKLATFVKDLFASELKEEQMRRAREAALEAQTSSMNIAEGAKQLDIVHREISITPVVAGAAAESGEALETMVTPIGTAIPKITTEEKRETYKKKRWPRAVAYVTILAAILYGVYHYVPAVRFWEKKVVPEGVEEFGQLEVGSVPEGAKIIINGQNTGLFTPATVDKLKLNTAYVLRLEKDEFKAVEYPIRLTSAALIPIQLNLERMGGILDVVSEPSGAAILFDSKATGKVTPATIEDITLDVDHRLTISKTDYEDFEQVINLTSSKPHMITVTLKAIEKAPPSAPPPTAPPPEAAKAAEMGSLEVTSNPAGAKILLDGRAVGKKTPATIGNLKVGKSYTVSLNKKDFEQWSKKVTIASSQPLSIEGELKPIEQPTAAIPPPTKTQPPVSPERKGEPGQIRIASNPSGAQVFINEEYKGTTPLTANVAPGTVSILVNKEGLMRYSRKITLKPGEKVNLTDIKLAGLYGEVSVSTSPPRASVVFDGQAISAKTPVTIRKVRRDQPHTISLSLSGYKTWTRSITMEEGNKILNVTLERQ